MDQNIRPSNNLAYFLFCIAWITRPYRGYTHFLTTTLPKSGWWVIIVYVKGERVKKKHLL